MKLTSPPRTAALAAAALALTTVAGFAAGKVRTRLARRRHPAPGAMVGQSGSRLHYVQQGSGPDLILIHGAAVTLGDMQPLIDVLARDHRVTAFDRPGHGHSDPAPREASPARQAEKIRAAVQALGLRRPVVVGHSLGGTVALAYGALYPAETAGVVALAPLAYPGWGLGHVSPALHAMPLLGPVLSHSLFALTDPLLMRLAPRVMFAPQAPTRSFRERMPTALASSPASMRADGADMIAASRALTVRSERYEDYPVPVQIVVGDRDVVLKPARQALRLAHDLPGAGLTVLPGIGHMLHHFQPEAVGTAVAAILASGAPVAQAA
jgi:pimeloyl-ACP methyl ester carboxylesterase